MCSTDLTVAGPSVFPPHLSCGHCKEHTEHGGLAVSLWTLQLVWHAVDPLSWKKMSMIKINTNTNNTKKIFKYVQNICLIL